MTYQKDINLKTSGHSDMHDLTDEVARLVEESGVRCGIVQRCGAISALQASTNQRDGIGNSIALESDTAFFVRA